MAAPLHVTKRDLDFVSKEIIEIIECLPDEDQQYDLLCLIIAHFDSKLDVAIFKEMVSLLHYEDPNSLLGNSDQ